MDASNPNIKDSQNFLHDNRLVSMLIGKSSIDEQDVVYEIGAGNGIITRGLAPVCKKVVAIEFSYEMAKALKQQFSGISNVEVVYADFLRYEITESTGYKFFSNIPFNITADILSKVLELDGVQDIYFILQYEAFLKYAGTPHYRDCLKSLLYKPFFEAELVYVFAPTDFVPVPKARIVLARFAPKVKADISLNHVTAYRDFLAFLFSENGNSFKEKSKKILSYEQLKRTTKSIVFSPDCAISEISYPQWIALFDIYLKYVPSEKKALLNGAYNRLLTQQGKLSKLHRNRNRNGGAPYNGKRKTN
jgi:23S rRNA (adenine-N6)-dimethyltransferase